jgi:hypothetical protein
MKTVTLRVFTEGLGHMQLTPINQDYAAAELNVYVTSTELSNSISVIDENNSETVYNNDDILKQLSFKWWDLKGLAKAYKETDYKEVFLNYCWDAGYDLYYDLEEVDSEDFVKILNKTEQIYNAQIPPTIYGDEKTLFIRLKTEPQYLEEDMIKEFIHAELSDYIFEDELDGLIFELNYGDIGKGIVEYKLELEDDEQFDINKLVFFCEEEWWDGWDLDSDIPRIFNNQDILLNHIVYNSKLYNAIGFDFKLGYKDEGETVIVYPNMEPVE